MRLLNAPNAAGRSAVIGRAPVRRNRWPVHRAQIPLLLASVGVIVGSFLPWVVTGFGTYHGVAGPGLWTFYAGIFGVAGGLVPSRVFALVHGVALAAAALALPVWQVQRLITRVGMTGWSPGFGMAIVLVCGAVAAQATWRLHSVQ